MSPTATVEVRCQGCGHALGTLRATETAPGWEAHWSGATATRGPMVVGPGPACLNGRAGLADVDDWNTIECSHCHRVWQGRDAQIFALPAGANDDGTVRLGQTTG